MCLAHYKWNPRDERARKSTRKWKEAVKYGGTAETGIDLRDGCNSRFRTGAPMTFRSCKSAHIPFSMRIRSGAKYEAYGRILCTPPASLDLWCSLASISWDPP